MAKLRLSYPAFRLPPVTSGAGALKTLGELEHLDRAVFMISGQASVRAMLEQALARGGVTISAQQSCRKPPGEPTRESIEAGAAFLHGSAPSALVAIGGGSVLDWARLSWARSAGLLSFESALVTDVAAVSRPTLVLVPTTCASGAEGATVAVYSDGLRKRAVVSPRFLADRVILDGMFLRSLDDVAFSASIADALSHSVESILSIVPNGLAKMAAGAALRQLLEHADGGVPTASRADRLLEASYFAGVAASHTSVGIAHAFAHAMAHEGLTHGRGNAIGLVPAVLFNESAPATAALLGAAGLQHTDLVARLRAIVRPARLSGAATTSAVLSDAGRRGALVERMLADTALRSNPVSAAAEDVSGFLNTVSQELHA